MLEQIIIAAILIPIIGSIVYYVTEYRTIARHKQEMDVEWSKYVNEPLGKKENATEKEERLF